MAARRKRLRKQLGGRELKPPKNFGIYLDENLHRCQLVLDVLSKHSVQGHCHYEYFPTPGVPDSAWLPKVGKHNWILLTTDEHFRYNELERLQLVKHKIRVYAFAKVVGAKAMADALSVAMKKIIHFSRSNKAPFVCSITVDGNVRLRWKPTKGEMRTAARMQEL
jgi:hypothetical protein